MGIALTAAPLARFVREDLSKPENRANFLLTAAQGIGPFWSRFARLINLDEECHVTPMIWPGGRPDLTVYRGEDPVAIIECENWGENKPQGAAYETMGCRLIWILGSQQPRDGTTWEEIQKIARAVSSDVDCRQAVTLRLLDGAITDILKMPYKTPMRKLQIPDDLPDNPWFCAAVAPLVEFYSSGHVGAHAGADGSASMRLRSRKFLAKPYKQAGVGLAMVQVGRPERVSLPSGAHLRRNLAPLLHPWIAEWENMLANVSVTPNGNGWLPIHVPNDEIDAATVAAAFCRLVERLRAKPGAPEEKITAPVSAP